MNIMEPDRLKICFLISHSSSKHEGAIRPFINWATEMRRENDVYFIFHKCAPSLVESLLKFEKLEGKSVSSLGEAIEYVNALRPRFLITDDYIERLKVIATIKENTGVKTGVYVQILYGFHSIADVFHLEELSESEKLAFRAMKFLPFEMIKARYKRLLREQDYIIANSQTTASMLHTLYGIEVDDVVYPPVDSAVFCPQVEEKKDQVLLYLGSHAGDTDSKLCARICEIVNQKKWTIVVFGNSKLRNELVTKFSATPLSNVTDSDLAKVYAQCRLAICPQKWETFGYVAAEAIGCGTTSLAFNCMGLAEVISLTGNGVLANNETEFLRMLSEYPSEMSKSAKSTQHPFSSRESAGVWLAFLRKQLD
jgi:hypothetical protein